jgi:hypothetical protein
MNERNSKSRRKKAEAKGGEEEESRGHSPE